MSYNTTAQVFFSSHPLIYPGHKQTKDAPEWRTSLTLSTKHSLWNCARKAGHEWRGPNTTVLHGYRLTIHARSV